MSRPALTWLDMDNAAYRSDRMQPDLSADGELPTYAFPKRNTARLAGLAILVVLYRFSKPSGIREGERQVLAARFHFTPVPLQHLASYDYSRQIRKMHLSLEHMDAWIYSMGAAVALADLDGDLLPELYYANDFGPDRLMHNRSTPGHPRFLEVKGCGGFTISPCSASVTTPTRAWPWSSATSTATAAWTSTSPTSPPNTPRRNAIFATTTAVSRTLRHWRVSAPSR